MNSPLPRLYYHRVINSMWAMLSHTQRKLPLNPGCFRMGCPNHGLWSSPSTNHQWTINENINGKMNHIFRWSMSHQCHQWEIPNENMDHQWESTRSTDNQWTINENIPIDGKSPYPRSHQCHHYPHHFACDSKEIITGWGPQSSELAFSCWMNYGLW